MKKRMDEEVARAKATQEVGVWQFDHFNWRNVAISLTTKFKE
jgi:hypothetical protein